MNLINKSDAKPDANPLFKKDKPDFSKNYLGVELEVEIPENFSVEECAGKVNEILGNFIILKEDASLTHGFEICSKPASLEFHIDKWKGFFENLNGRIDTAYIKKEKRTETCGMHVHINRNPLSNLQIAKIVTFIHSKENRDFITTIAGRESNSFCDFISERTLKVAHRKNYIHLPKYSGVNLHNRDTIEIRIFKGVVNFESFLKNLEFCDALVQFTLPGRATIKDSLNYKNFILFLKPLEETYPNLTKFLKGANFLEKLVSKPLKLNPVKEKLIKQSIFSTI